MELNPAKIMQTGLAFWESKTLLSAVELELFTELAKHPSDHESLQRALGLHPRGSRDFFDALVALGFLKRENGLYSNTPETDLFLDKSKASYVGGTLEYSNSRLYPNWKLLTAALRTGRPQSDSNRVDDLYSQVYDDPAKTKEFLRAMSGISRPANIAIAQRLPWGPYKTFLDVGAAQGDLAVQIALANPHLTGTGFDLPPVKSVFEEYVAENQLNSRVKFVSGNFFTDPFPEADVILLGHVLHNWDLEEKKMLLGKAYAALPVGGTVVVYEPIIDDERSKNAFGLTMSLNMLVETYGGFDFTRRRL